jgi:transketolase
VVRAEKRQQLDAAIRAIGRAGQSLASTREPDWSLFVQIVREIEMQNNTEWSKKYYSPDAQQKVDERKKLWSPELQERVTKEWNALLADVGAAVDANEAPASARGQALAARWRKLVEGFTGGDPEIQKGLNKMWADQQNWPADMRGRIQIDPRIQEFIVAAMKAK